MFRTTKGRPSQQVYLVFSRLGLSHLKLKHCKYGHFVNEYKSKNNCIAANLEIHSTNASKTRSVKKFFKAGPTKNNLLLTVTNLKTELKYLDTSLNI